MAGPSTRERLNWIEFSATPLPICSRGTNSGTMDWKAGIDSASVMPTTADSPITIHGFTLSVSRSTTRIVGHIIWID